MATLAGAGDTIIIGVGTKVFAFSIANASSAYPIAKGEIDVSLLCQAIPFTKHVDGTEKKEQELAHHGITVVAACFSRSGSLVAIATTAKTVLLFQFTDSLSFSRGFRIPKSPTKLIFDPEDKFVVVADRAGVVRRYPVEASEGDVKTADDDEDSDEFGFCGDFLCSAISMFLDISFSTCGRFLVVADRDEKLRVYRYPEAFILESLCLGHRDYVASLAVQQATLFSAGGDGTLIAWRSSGEEFTRSQLSGGPIRVIGAFNLEGKIMVAAVMNRSGIVHVLELSQDSLRIKMTMDTKHDILDILPVSASHSWLLLTRNGLSMMGMAGEVHEMYLGKDVLSLLSSAADPFSDLAKKTAYDNMADYQDRKAAKFEKKREKRKATEAKDESEKKRSQLQ